MITRRGHGQLPSSTSSSPPRTPVAAAEAIDQRRHRFAVALERGGIVYLQLCHDVSCHRPLPVAGVTLQTPFRRGVLHLEALEKSGSRHGMATARLPHSQARTLCSDGGRHRADARTCYRRDFRWGGDGLEVGRASPTADRPLRLYAISSMKDASSTAPLLWSRAAQRSAMRSRSSGLICRRYRS
jgi:hypothetical protein